MDAKGRTDDTRDDLPPELDPERQRRADQEMNPLPQRGRVVKREGGQASEEASEALEETVREQDREQERRKRTEEEREREA